MMGKFKEKQIKQDDYYMKLAIASGERSYDEKHKVGAVLVRDTKILADGYNGTPSGMDNETRHENGTSKWAVVHAEANALCKLARSTETSEGSTLYCTLSPCTECSKLLLQAGVVRVVYGEEYQAVAIKFLKDNGVRVERY